MRKKNQEVTGKPTQYNLQTLEYDWKQLPNSHRVFDNANKQNQNPPQNEPEQSRQVSLPGAPYLDAPYAQEPFNNMSNDRDPFPVENYGNGRGIELPQAYYDAPYGNGDQPGANELSYQSRALDMQNPFAGNNSPENVLPVHWTHDDLKRITNFNYMEAHRSYM
ncbi:hypothetical protein ADEAN_000006800 [Angomonas deanei]|uniref:Uncharacterized protein n=1 Tax=Angomonas deanei TaxID=59799 RepID=A0A7G2BYH9_9TRYP|nr:hypothetical protein ADEAN_000006800 [Angomonas deanei]